MIETPTSYDLGVADFNRETAKFEPYFEVRFEMSANVAAASRRDVAREASPLATACESNATESVRGYADEVWAKVDQAESAWPLVNPKLSSRFTNPAGIGSLRSAAANGATNVAGMLNTLDSDDEVRAALTFFNSIG